MRQPGPLTVPLQPDFTDVAYTHAGAPVDANAQGLLQIRQLKLGDMQVFVPTLGMSASDINNQVSHSGPGH
jgi:hypothetical protein